MNYLPGRHKFVQISPPYSDTFQRLTKFVFPEHTSPPLGNIFRATKPCEDAYNRQPGWFYVRRLPVIHICRVHVRHVVIVVHSLQRFIIVIFYIIIVVLTICAKMIGRRSWRRLILLEILGQTYRDGAKSPLSTLLCVHYAI